MNEMMQSSGMMWGMGLIWLLIVTDLLLGGAALIKYLLTSRNQ